MTSDIVGQSGDIGVIVALEGHLEAANPEIVEKFFTISGGCSEWLRFSSKELQ